MNSIWFWCFFLNKCEEKENDFVETIDHTSETNFDKSKFWLVDIISNNCFVSWRNDDDDDVRAGLSWFSLLNCVFSFLSNSDVNDGDDCRIDGRTNIFVDGSGSCWRRSPILNIYGSFSIIRLILIYQFYQNSYLFEVIEMKMNENLE